MLKSISFRGLKEAAAKHAAGKELAAGDEASKLKTKQLLTDKANGGRSRHCFTAPREPDASLYGALLSDERYEEVPDYDEQQLAIAASTLAAATIKTAGLDASAARCALNVVISAASARFSRPLFA